MATKNLMVRAGADFSAITKQSQRAQASLSSLGKAGKAVRTTLSAVGVGLSFAAIVSGSKEAYAAYTKQAEAESKLAQVMRNTMGASRAEIQAIKDLTGAQQALGIVGDEVQLAGAQELATYLTLGSSLKTLIPVLNDMTAQQYGYNATAEQSAAIATMLGKVMSGQVGGLSRYGYYFDEAQEAVLKFGTEEERAAMLAEVVSASVGGMNQALANTDAGRLVQVRNTLGDIKEIAGEAFSNLVAAAMPAITSIVNGLAKIAQWGLYASQVLRAVFGGGEVEEGGYIAGLESAADSIEDAGSSVAGSVGGAASKLKAAVMGFDTIQRLSGGSSSGGGGGGGVSASGLKTSDSLTKTGKASSAAADNLDKVARKAEELRKKLGPLNEKWNTLVGLLGEPLVGNVQRLGKEWDAVFGHISYDPVDMAEELLDTLISISNFMSAPSWQTFSDFFSKNFEFDKEAPIPKFMRWFWNTPILEQLGLQESPKKAFNASSGGGDHHSGKIPMPTTSTTGADMAKAGSAAVAGFLQGWNASKSKLDEANLQEWYQKNVNKHMSKELWDGLWEGSTQGFVSGYTARKSDLERPTLAGWLKDKVLPFMSASAWADAWESAKAGFSSGWLAADPEIRKATLSEWFSTKISPWLKKDTWQGLFDGARAGFDSGFDSASGDFNRRSLGPWFTDRVAAWFAVDKWSDVFSGASAGFAKGFTAAEEGFKRMSLKTWFEDSVSPWFTKDKWSGLFDSVRSGFSEGWTKLSEWWSGLKLGKFQIETPHFSWSSTDVSGSTGEALQKLGIPGKNPNLEVSWYASGGFPEDGLFWSNHNELVGKFSNGKTAVANNAEITEGISRAVSSANTRVEAAIRGSTAHMAALLAPVAAAVPNVRTASGPSGSSADSAELVRLMRSLVRIASSGQTVSLNDREVGRLVRRALADEARMTGGG